MSRSPYRVGMARPAQRVLEPTEIYSDLRVGQGTSMPDNFPYTWTPVNGLGALPGRTARATQTARTATSAESALRASGQRARAAPPPAESGEAQQASEDPEATAREREEAQKRRNMMLAAAAVVAIGFAFWRLRK